MNPNAENFSRDIAGNALLEFALVLPVILLLIFGGLEIAGTISGVQAANYLSREVATLAFRNCALDSTAQDSEPTSYQNGTNCLQGVVNAVLGDTTGILPGTNVALSIYNITYGGDPDGDTTLPPDPPVLTATFATGGMVSKFSTGNFTSTATPLDSALKELLLAHRTVVVSEVRVPLTSVSGSLPRLWTYGFFSTDLIGFTDQGNISAATIL